jgi:hypothetical protein
MVKSLDFDTLDDNADGFLQVAVRVVDILWWKIVNCMSFGLKIFMCVCGGMFHTCAYVHLVAQRERGRERDI